MDDSLEIPVLKSDLTVVLAALRSAYYHNVALDMADNYRKLNNRGQSTPMSKALEGAVEKIEAYLKESDNDVSE